MLIRDAQECDLPAIVTIFNHAIAHTTAVWREDLVDLADRRAWWEGRQAQGYPVLVAQEASGAVVGFASFGDFRSFPGYCGTVEHSVYVAEAARGRGVAQALMADLIEAARALGKHAMIGAVAAENAVSVRLHERLGFKEVGLMPQVGQKFGNWLDLLLLQLLLDDRPAP